MCGRELLETIRRIEGIDARVNDTVKRLGVSLETTLAAVLAAAGDAAQLQKQAHTYYDSARQAYEGVQRNMANRQVQWVYQLREAQASFGMYQVSVVAGQADGTLLSSAQAKINEILKAYPDPADRPAYMLPVLQLNSAIRAAVQ